MSQLSKNEKMPSCPVSQIRKLYQKTLGMEDNAEITLELLLTLCFPTVWTNIQKAMVDNYTQGYIAGVNEKKNADKGTN